MNQGISRRDLRVVLWDDEGNWIRNSEPSDAELVDMRVGRVWCRWQVLAALGVGIGLGLFVVAPLFA